MVAAWEALGTGQPQQKGTCACCRAHCAGPALLQVYLPWLCPNALQHQDVLRVQGLQVQNMVWPPAIISTITAAVNVPVNAVLINWYGFHGAAAATSVTRIFQLIMLMGERPCVRRGPTTASRLPASQEGGGGLHQRLRAGRSHMSQCNLCSVALRLSRMPAFSEIEGRWV